VTRIRRQAFIQDRGRAVQALFQLNRAAQLRLSFQGNAFCSANHHKDDDRAIGVDGAPLSGVVVAERDLT
jgi:hypothetical protein